MERFGSSARGRLCVEQLISAAENEEMIGCGPNEKEDPIETRLRELAADGRRGIGGTTKVPAGGGVEVILRVNDIFEGVPESSNLSKIT
jgi:hypothetical protein